MLYVLVSLLVVALFRIAYREWLSRVRAAFYTKQGFETHLSFFTSKLTKMEVEGMGTENGMGPLAAAIHQATKKSAPGVVFNSPPNGKAIVLLSDIALIREFSLIESEVALKGLGVDNKLRIGFVDLSGHIALEQRAIFAEFFRVDNLAKQIAPLASLIEDCFKVDRDSDGNLLISDSKKLVDNIKVRTSSFLIFGDGTNIRKADSGLAYGEELRTIMDIVWSEKAVYHPFNRLVENYWAHNLNLLPGSREANKRARSMDKILAKFIEERLNDPEKYAEERNRNCLVNLLLDYNHTVPVDKKLTIEEMIGNCNVFLLAGFDTTVTAMNSILYNLAHRPDILRQLREETKHLDLTNLTLEELDSVEYLDRLVKEAIRINPPTPEGMFRRFATDFKLGKYEFKKGDQILIPFGPLMWDPTEFPQERKFDVQAINETNKRAFMPFYMGKRNCVGQILAQIELKIFAVFVAQRFTIKPLTEKSLYRLGFSFQMFDCQVQLRDLPK